MYSDDEASDGYDSESASEEDEEEEEAPVAHQQEEAPSSDSDSDSDDEDIPAVTKNTIHQTSRGNGGMLAARGVSTPGRGRGRGRGRGMARRGGY